MQLPAPAPQFSVTATATPTMGGTTSSRLDYVTLGLDFIGASRGEVAVELVAPGDTTYQRMTAQLTGSPWQTQHVDFVVPIAGTWIDSQAMNGTWYAHVFFKGVERLTQSFEVAP